MGDSFFRLFLSRGDLSRSRGHLEFLPMVNGMRRCTGECEGAFEGGEQVL